jgi:haloalkane dehalogenase
MTRDGLGQLLRGLGGGFDDDAVDEYWRTFVDEDRRRSVLDFYRSCDFEKIARYDGCLESFDAPVLVLWGEEDPFAPIGGAHRFVKTFSDTRLVVVDGAQHFVYEDAPERTAREVVSFLGRL